jgi:CheY-like chemotaxis protein
LHGLRNGLSNALKYGPDKRAALDVAYCSSTDPKLLQLKITNKASLITQRRLIEQHGNDATHLLREQGHRGGESSTLLGGRALTTCAALLGGAVTLCLGEAETTCLLTFPVRAPTALDRDLVVVFVDDSQPILFFWNAMLSAPLSGWVIPALDCSDEDADAAMSTVAATILAADPRPDAVVLDQNLVSRVSSQLLITTGTQIARQLRQSGYAERILISSANSGATDLENYYAAGANGFVAKGTGREALLDALALAQQTPQPAAEPEVAAPEVTFKDLPLLQQGHSLWSLPTVGVEVRQQMADASRQETANSCHILREYLAGNGTDTGMRSILHRLHGSMLSAGFPRAVTIVLAMRNGAVTERLISQLEAATEGGAVEILKVPVPL